MAGGAGGQQVKLPALALGRREHGSMTARDKLEHDELASSMQEGRRGKSEVRMRGGHGRATGAVSERSHRHCMVDQSVSSLMIGNVPKYYTVKVTLESAVVVIDGESKERSVKVCTSMDGVTFTSTSCKVLEADNALSINETYIFHPQGSLLGSFLLIRALMSPVKSEQEEVAMGVVDLSGASSSDGIIRIQRKLKSEGSKLHVSVNLSIQVLPRSKSFSISWGSESDSIFRRSGFAVSSRGLVSTPQPYQKRGLPKHVSFSDLRLVRKVAEEAEGYEVWRAVDANKRWYTVRRFLVTKKQCRQMLTSCLSGLIDMEGFRSVGVCDAFLVGLNQYRRMELRPSM
ncbi:hypothetical protein GUITHDRAFT_143483 [Guillardia theta CCMP2712]|uniref:Uncharacterized protein n=1 Tax=Guillardia theta (strain CCMP2712) TaxID=905079 RepID=L1ITD8_GUITC|nr:hypothetical protein GUITHDRAFT_143483 [Guillardia theta CCMP2712]EKX39498.1 hypothetical protein GUITHDRAFT_143483 [Guillardia theta CCMP2712]|eukprot:XP_005826478.1 hypothetical protein GUITHDRAFT_143483 [Guillardia theta CCMP2712]